MDMCGGAGRAGYAEGYDCDGVFDIYGEMGEYGWLWDETVAEEEDDSVGDATPKEVKDEAAGSFLIFFAGGTSDAVTAEGVWSP